jgi:predicted TIM-barrel fold metal-dependent hydrolase
MTVKPSCRVIAIEEHYWDPDITGNYGGVEATRNPEMLKRLYDLGEYRISEMDKAGVDMQVLSHGAPSLQKIESSLAVDLARRANDKLASACAKYPTRFAAFAALPTTAAPELAAAELERCVTMGFKGAMIHGLSNGEFLDEPKFDPIWAMAERLDVPIYLHPSVPHQAVTDVYYKKYMQDFPMVIRAAWGFTVETATIAIRMVLGGVFERHPKLKLILGHFGETLPFLVWRIDQALKRPGAKPMSFRKVFSNNFYVTTSGNFSNPALLCTMMEMGIDRILFAIDYPFVMNEDGMEWIPNMPICEEDKIKLLSGNAMRLLKL